MAGRVGGGFRRAGGRKRDSIIGSAGGVTGGKSQGESRIRRA